MHLIRTIFVVAAVLVANLAFAAGKVAVFDSQAAILNTDFAKKRLTDLQKDPEFSSMRAKFEGLKSDLQSLNKEAETNGMTWSSEQVASHRKKMEYKNADLQLIVKKLQAEESAAVQRIVQELSPKVKTAINEVITSEGIDLLLHSKVAFYVNPNLDITTKITEKLNKAK